MKILKYEKNLKQCELPNSSRLNVQPQCQIEKAHPSVSTLQTPRAKYCSLQKIHVEEIEHDWQKHLLFYDSSTFSTTKSDIIKPIWKHPDSREIWNTRPEIIRTLLIFSHQVVNNSCKILLPLKTVIYPSNSNMKFINIMSCSKDIEVIYLCK